MRSGDPLLVSPYSADGRALGFAETRGEEADAARDGGRSAVESRGGKGFEMGVAVGPCSCNGSLVWTLFVLKLEEGEGGGSSRRGGRARMETVGITRSVLRPGRGAVAV